jgi:hypothetical protein
MSFLTSPQTMQAFNLTRGLGGAVAAATTTPINTNQIPANAAAIQAQLYNQAAPNFNEAQGIQLQELNMNQQSANAQASAVEDNAQITNAEAAIQGNQFAAQQALSYSSSGVELQGSPMLALQDTYNKMNIAAMATTQQAQMTAQNIRMQGIQSALQGRASLLGNSNKFTTGALNADMNAVNLAANNTATSPLGNALTALSGIFGGTGGVPKTKNTNSGGASPSTISGTYPGTTPISLPRIGP